MKSTDPLQDILNDIEKRKAANIAFWKRQDEAARARGMNFRSGHACGGNKYHRTREAAERAAKRTARKACPGNPPAWHVVPL